TGVAPAASARHRHRKGQRSLVQIDRPGNGGGAEHRRRQQCLCTLGPRHRAVVQEQGRSANPCRGRQTALQSVWRHAGFAMAGPAAAATVQLYAAGSLKGALTDVAKAYEAMTGNKIDGKYGPSGLLKNEISGGAKAHVFASANMEHPQALRDEKKSGTVLRFARNKLCALVKPGLAVDNVTLLDRMLDPGVKLGTSTPKADPSSAQTTD